MSIENRSNPRIELAPGFKELDRARMLLGYLRCSSLSLEYCREHLDLVTPLETVEILNTIGKKAGFQILHSQKDSSLTLTNDIAGQWCDHA